jgi:hypothetical protein
MKEQKAKTLQSLASKRLPDTLVDVVSAQPVQQQSHQDSEKKQRKRTKSGNASSGHISIFRWLLKEMICYLMNCTITRV